MFKELTEKETKHQVKAVKKAIKILKDKTSTAEHLGISLPYLSQIFSGKRPIPPGPAIRLQELTGVSVNKMRPDIFEKVYRCPHCSKRIAKI